MCVLVAHAVYVYVHRQESLDFAAVGDDLKGEQTWPSEAEMQEADSHAQLDLTRRQPPSSVRWIQYSVMHTLMQYIHELVRVLISGPQRNVLLSGRLVHR